MNEKVALITGSGKRVGAVIAESLHQKGWRVLIHYRNASSEALSLIQKLNTIRKDSAFGIQANLCCTEELNTLANTAQAHWGRIDALINNASTFYPTPLQTATLASWEELLASNVKAPFFLSQSLLPALKKTQGNIINMVDIHADRPLPEHSIYCMAKAALVSMTKSLARELAPDIRVNAIAPGMILWPDDATDDALKTRLRQRIPLKREGSPKDIAETVNFLLEASFITGQILSVDGGRSIVL